MTEKCKNCGHDVRLHLVGIKTECYTKNCKCKKFEVEDLKVKENNSPQKSQNKSKSVRVGKQTEEKKPSFDIREGSHNNGCGEIYMNMLGEERVCGSIVNDNQGIHKRLCKKCEGKK